MSVPAPRVPGMEINPQHILVLRGGALGDCILTLPALECLRERWPGARVTLAGRLPAARLVVDGGWADQVLDLDGAGLLGLFASDAAMADPARIGDVDLAVLWVPDEAGTVSAALRRAGARVVITVPPPNGSCHAADQYVRDVRQALGLAVAGGAGIPHWRIPELSKRPAQVPGGRIVVLHPGSGSPRKNWPLPCFLELAGEIEHRLDAPCVLTIGEADSAIMERLAARRERFPVVSGLSLMDLAALLAGAAGYVGNDSGVSHLAGLVGTPTVAVFGPTDPTVWGPRGRGVRIVRATGPEGDPNAPVDAVLGALREVIRAST